MVIALKGVSFFIPTYDYIKKSLILIGCTSLVSIIYSVVKFPTYKETGKVVDYINLKNRVTTFLEMEDNNSPYYELLFEDVKLQLKNFDIKKLKIKPNIKYIKIFSITFLAFFLAIFIPNPLKEEASKLKALNTEQKNEVKKVEKIEKELKSDKEVSEIKKLQIENQLKELKKEIKKSKSEKEIAKALEKTSVKLDNVKNKNLNNIAKNLEKNKNTEKLAEALKNKDKKKAEEELKNLKSKIKDMKDDEKNKLAESLKEAMENTDNEELSKALKNVMNNMEGNDENLESSLNDLNSELSEEMNDDAIESVKGKVSKGCNSSGGTWTAGSGSSGTASKSSSSGNGNGNGNGSGSGAGSGTTVKDTTKGSQLPSNGGIGNNKKSNDENTDWDKVFVGERVDGKGKNENLQGKVSENGESTTQNSNKANTSAGNYVDYNKALGSYKDAAMESIENNKIPESMKNIIKEYFSKIEE